MTVVGSVALGACTLAIVCADLRWFRVAQREHYLAGALARFSWRWVASMPINGGLALLAAASGGDGGRRAPGWRS